jgi:peroxiredoxin
VPRIDPAPDLARRLAPIVLPSTSGDDVVLGSLWSDRPAVLVHFRHFGCVICRHYATTLGRAHAQFVERGATIVAVGTGGRRYAREFKQARGLPFDVLVDRELRSYGEIGAKSGGPLGLLSPGVLAGGARAIVGGALQGRTGAHPWLFGGAHVIAPDGGIALAWVSEDFVDNAPVESLLAALDA